jgi:short-subunit dehydrogenase
VKAKVRSVLIVGATAGIAQALVHEFARRRYALVLAARDEAELAVVAADVRVRYGTKVTTLTLDAVNYRTHPAFWKRCLAACDNELYGVVLCHGSMTPQAAAERDFAAARAMIDINYTSCVSLLNLAANTFEARGCGFICALSSVAGDRGRAANYIYGSAKGGLDVYLQGLRQRLHKVNVGVTTVKPGPVDTAMTWGMKMPLMCPPQKVASDIYRALRRRKDVVYTPAPGYFIMAVFRAVPEWLWKRLNF